jgi:hypothetical protein
MEQRTAFLGGSEVAAVLGVSPYDTPLDVYMRKTRREDEPAGTLDPWKARLFRWGKLLEPVVIKHLRADYGIRVTKTSTPRRPNRYTDPEFPFLQAEIDFEWRVTRQNALDYRLAEELVGTVQNGEVKTVHTFAAAKFGDAETEDVPIEYAAQAMAGLMITGRKLTLFGVLTGTRDVTIYWIKRDEETIAAMRPKLVAFWNDHVLAGVPPDPINLPDVLRLFRKAPASQRVATPEMLELCEELKHANDAAAAAEEWATECKYELGKYILGATGILLGNKGRMLPAASTMPGKHLLLHDGRPALIVSLIQTSRLDGERFEHDHPELAAAYQKQISFFRFDRPRRKA